MAINLLSSLGITAAATSKLGKTGELLTKLQAELWAVQRTYNMIKQPISAFARDISDINKSLYEQVKVFNLSTRGLSQYVDIVNRLSGATRVGTKELMSFVGQLKITPGFVSDNYRQVDKYLTLIDKKFPFAHKEAREKLLQLASGMSYAIEWLDRGRLTFSQNVEIVDKFDQSMVVMLQTLLGAAPELDDNMKAAIRYRESIDQLQKSWSNLTVAIKMKVGPGLAFLAEGLDAVRELLDKLGLLDIKVEVKLEDERRLDNITKRLREVRKEREALQSVHAADPKKLKDVYDRCIKIEEEYWKESRQIWEKMSAEEKELYGKPEWRQILRGLDPAQRKRIEEFNKLEKLASDQSAKTDNMKKYFDVSAQERQRQLNALKKQENILVEEGNKIREKGGKSDVERLSEYDKLVQAGERNITVNDALLGIYGAQQRTLTAHYKPMVEKAQIWYKELDLLSTNLSEREKIYNFVLKEYEVDKKRLVEELNRAKVAKDSEAQQRILEQLAEADLKLKTAGRVVAEAAADVAEKETRIRRSWMEQMTELALGLPGGTYTMQTGVSKRATYGPGYTPLAPLTGEKEAWQGRRMPGPYGEQYGVAGFRTRGEQVTYEIMQQIEENTRKGTVYAGETVKDQKEVISKLTMPKVEGIVPSVLPSGAVPRAPVAGVVPEYEVGEPNWLVDWRLDLLQEVVELKELMKKNENNTRKIEENSGQVR